ncbi:PG0541 family transporter-associated protein [Macellibacteroides fermentans]|jgi:nitrogen regulatory protein PII|uniref:PG0541 family transporter-associated protein n=1 Tax=Macellibacteroides fermentans TaxID=879969 RepID=UPI00406C86BA
MKAIFISFNQAYYDMIITTMDRNNLRGFTYWDEVRGRGSKTGEPHYGSHAWPTMNSAILTMVEDDKVDNFLDLLHKMDEETEALGLRAFAWNIEKTI